MTDYIGPSECDRYVPLETTSEGPLPSWMVEIAHQATRPNSPKGNR